MDSSDSSSSRCGHHWWCVRRLICIDVVYCLLWTCEPFREVLTSRRISILCFSVTHTDIALDEWSLASECSWQMGAVYERSWINCAWLSSSAWKVWRLQFQFEPTLSELLCLSLVTGDYVWLSFNTVIRRHLEIRLKTCSAFLVEFWILQLQKTKLEKIWNRLWSFSHNLCIPGTLLTSS